MKKFLFKLKSFILNLFFPIKCISCSKEDLWLCKKCHSKITLRAEQVCGVCEKFPTPDGRTCLSCKKRNALDGLLVACDYRQTIAIKMIHFFKYRFIPDLHEPLGELLIAAIRKTNLPLPDIIVPVPLHPRRLRWRGFNQAELLANHLAKNLLPDFELKNENNLLKRNRHTSPQMKIRDYHSRQENIAQAFSLSSGIKIENKTLLLVDDVVTTGSTIFECARVLKKAGASEVFAVVIARQEIKHKS